MSKPDQEQEAGVDRRAPDRLASVIRHCPMCGYDFDEAEHAGCTSCPFNRQCRVLCCPRCGYDFVEDSWLVDRWRDLIGLFRRNGQGEEGR